MRHLTDKKSLKSIVKEGALDKKYNSRKCDGGYISFEANPPNDLFIDIFSELKKWDSNDIFELVFDAEKLLKDNYQILSTIPGKNNSKFEIKWLWDLENKPDNTDKIGDYAFIKSNVPLKYLTKESRNKLLDWAKENSPYKDLD